MTQTSPGFTSSSQFETYGSRDNSGSFGATGSFSAHSAGHDAQAQGYGGSSYHGSQSSSSGFSSQGSGSSGFGIHAAGYPGGVTQRREMEVEEHYENGQLVHGREEKKEWENENLLNHERRQYGEVILIKI